MTTTRDTACANRPRARWPGRSRRVAVCAWQWWLPFPVALSLATALYGFGCGLPLTGRPGQLPVAPVSPVAHNLADRQVPVLSARVGVVQACLAVENGTRSDCQRCALPRRAVVSIYLGTRRCDMPATATQAVRATPAAEFRLPATDGKTYALDDVAGEKGTVVVFICNHCPYVKAVIDRMVSDARVLTSEGVGFAAICSNDAASYPEDSFENMKRFAKAHDFPFPYLHDETQTVARAYGAVCTPHFFGYNTDRRLKYRGRLDEGRTTPPRAEAPRELVEAMRAIATTGVAPDHQKASIGCSIKWKDE